MIKSLFCTLFGLVLLLAMACAEAVLGDDPFVKAQGIRFVLKGQPFLFNGFNSYWMIQFAADAADRTKVSEVFREAVANGLTVCRTWAFNDGGYRALQVSPGVYDEQVFQGLDFMISEAQKNGVRLILSLVNNYKDFGGRSQYVDWAREAGEAVNNEDDFYTNPIVKNYYKSHVKSVLTRVNTITKMAYRDDPTIMAWELINEPRCHSDYSGRTINDWVQEMASYTKSIDSKHMLEIGMEGFYCDSTTPAKKQFNPPGYQVGTDYIRANLIKDIDFATIHAYPDIWLSGQSDRSQKAFVLRWMWSHWEDARKIHRKPLLLAEFGKSKKDPPGDSVDSYLAAVYRGVYGLARAGGGSMGGSLVWQVMAEGMESYHDGYEIILSQDTSTAGVISRQSRLMSALAHNLGGPPAGEESGGGGGDEQEASKGGQHG
ncbi:mannan endo-1,4-beta-mannosidase 5-like [Typha angustifolia]|uniref:mannan endo-1,4-beta-mannosidase 5-like n=1 Tax=Typha angustifolia TaxID=59011 RepID=UPI003C2EDD23